MSEKSSFGIRIVFSNPHNRKAFNVYNHETVDGAITRIREIEDMYNDGNPSIDIAVEYNGLVMSREKFMKKFYNKELVI